MCMDTGAALGAPRAARPRACQRQRWAHHRWRRHRRSGILRHASGAHAAQRRWRGALHLVRLFLLSLHYGYLYLLWLYYGYTYYGEVRYTEYLGADGNAHTASIWWALSDPALGAWAFGGGGGGGASSPPATAAAAAATTTAELQLSRRRRRRAAAAELQLELRQLTRVARRVDYTDPTVAGWRGDGLPVLTSERAPSHERNSRRVKRGLARVRDAHASCPLAPLQWPS